MKLENIIKSLICAVGLGSIVVTIYVTDNKTKIPRSVCISPVIERFSPGVVDLSRDDNDNDDLGKVARTVVNNVFDISNHSLNEELLGNVIVYRPAGYEAFDVGRYISSSKSDCSRDVIFIKRRSESAIAHELLHDVWTNYLEDEKKEEFLSLSRAYHQKISSSEYERSRKSDCKDDCIDETLKYKLVSYLKNFYHDSVENPDPKNIDDFLGTEAYAYIGEFILRGKPVPEMFLPFYESVFKEDILKKARTVAIKEN